MTRTEILNVVTRFQARYVERMSHKFYDIEVYDFSKAVRKPLMWFADVTQ